MYDIKSMSSNELAEVLKSLGQPGYRADQVFKWLRSGVTGYDEMTSLPKALREQLNAEYPLYTPKLATMQKSKDGTVKLLWELQDGNSVESVVMTYKHGNTVCISTQVGCRMGCAFCASTVGGLIRNLSPSEMLDQVRYSAKESGLDISNIVMMGIGEPLDNLENVVRFLELVNHPDGLNIGMRHISLSTCGPKGGIDKLAQYNLQITLSVSLHAPDDETRSKIMPINRSTGVAELIESCKRYCIKTGRRISFEYLMADGVNDTSASAFALAKLLLGMGKKCAPLIHVNLIPLNPIEGALLKPSSDKTVITFSDILTSKGINTTVRRRMGSDIDAACGQLRRRQSQHSG